MVEEFGISLNSVSDDFIRLNILKIRVINCEVLLSLLLLYNYLAWLAIIKWSNWENLLHYNLNRFNFN